MIAFNSYTEYRVRISYQVFLNSVRLVWSVLEFTYHPKFIVDFLEEVSMSEIGKKLGGAAGRVVGQSERIPIDEETAEVAGEVTGEMIETGVAAIADEVTK